MKILDLIKRCDSWTRAKRPQDGRYTVAIHFDTREDAEQFADEVLKVTISDPPYRGS